MPLAAPPDAAGGQPQEDLQRGSLLSRLGAHLALAFRGGRGGRAQRGSEVGTDARPAAHAAVNSTCCTRQQQCKPQPATHPSCRAPPPCCGPGPPAQAPAAAPALRGPCCGACGSSEGGSGPRGWAVEAGRGCWLVRNGLQVKMDRQADCHTRTTVRSRGAAYRQRYPSNSSTRLDTSCGTTGPSCCGARPAAAARRDKAKREAAAGAGSSEGKDGTARAQKQHGGKEKTGVQQPRRAAQHPPRSTTGPSAGGPPSRCMPSMSAAASSAVSGARRMESSRRSSDCGWARRGEEHGRGIEIQVWPRPAQGSPHSTA